MDLRARLSRLDRTTRRPTVGETGPHPAAAAPPTGTPDVPDELQLTRTETTAGPIWWRDRRDPVAPPTDPVVDLTGLFARDAALRPRVDRLLLLDTETTGLAGGTGTLVFQIGLSWWEGAELVTRQHFLPGPAHEPALLAALAELAGRFEIVVTYNGASFDLPLLRTRALLNRLPDPLGHLAVWDLLVPARRLWGSRLPDCRQQTLEAAVCGGRRGPGDIDGSRIPQTWFDFLADGQPGLLPNVLTHNHRDMVGMARLLQRIAEIGAWLAAGPPRELPPDWQDRAGAWALGRIRERRREPAAAGACFAAAWAGAWGVRPEPVAGRRFRRDAIRNLKRVGRWDLVEAVIRDGLDSDARDVELHREAAILYEHRLGDAERARHHAVRCGDPHRVARLDHRLDAAAGPPKGRDDGEPDT